MVQRQIYEALGIDPPAELGVIGNPGISASTVEMALATLVKEGYIIKVGADVNVS